MTKMEYVGYVKEQRKKGRDLSRGLLARIKS